MKYLRKFDEGEKYDINNYTKDNICLDINGDELKVGDKVRTMPNQDAFDMESIDINEFSEEVFTIGKIEKHEFGSMNQYNYLKGIYKVFYENSGSWFYNIECEKID